MTATGISKGSGIGGNSGNDRYNTNGWGGSLDTNDYFEFTMDANSGYTLDLTSLTLTMQKSSTGPGNLAIRSSLNNFGSNLQMGTVTGTNTVTFSLSDASFNALSESITFRIYAWGATAGTGTLSVNDFSFEGTVNTAAALNNSAITTSTGTVNFGGWLTSSTALTQDITINKTGSEATTYTTTAGGNATVSGAGTSFAGGSQSDTITVGVNRSTSGVKTGTVTVDNTATTTAGSGQGSADSNDVVNVSATVFDAASVTANNSSALDVSDGSAEATLQNASGTYRAPAQINGAPTVTGTGFSLLGGFVDGARINPGSLLTGNIAFDSTGLLNGQYTGTLVVGLENSSLNFDNTITIQGVADGDLGSRTWNLVANVTGRQASSGAVTLAAGTDLAGRGIGLQHNTGAQTSASFLDGTAGSQPISMSFKVSSEALNDANRVSDVLTVTGLDGNLFVLEMTYSESGLLVPENDLFLAWLDELSGLWVNATAGNSSGTATFAGNVAYNAALHSALGTYGVDTTTNTVWAVLDHNSDFAVVAVPEPGVLGLALIGAGALLRRRRR
jgi:hypothetical protein